MATGGGPFPPNSPEGLRIASDKNTQDIKELKLKTTDLDYELRGIQHQAASFAKYGEDLQQLELQATAISSSFASAQKVADQLKQQQQELRDKLEGFYGKLIEIFGLFIAVFSFIIAGIQISTKVEGSPIEMLGKSLALFVPLTFCIVLLLCVIRWTSRRV